MEHSVTRPLSSPASATVPLLSGQGNYCLVLIPSTLDFIRGFIKESLQEVSRTV